MTKPLNLQSLFELQRPQSVALYDTYEDAQRAVDYLADAKFPVQSLVIVGTDLKSIERITGELSWGKVVISGAISGISWGAMIAFLLYFVQPERGLAGVLVYGLVLGSIAGAVSNAISYALSRGRKDYSSMTQTIATHYEILGEAEFAPQARQLLSGGEASEPTRVVDRSALLPPHRDLVDVESREQQSRGSESQGNPSADTSDQR